MMSVPPNHIMLQPRPIKDSLTGRYRENRHDFDGFAREDRKVRMVFKELGGGLVRGGADNPEGAHVVGPSLDAACVDLLGLAERPADLDERGVMLLDPGLPGRDTLLLFRAPLCVRKGVPSGHFRAGLAAKEDGEKGIGHDRSFWGWSVS